MNCPNCGLVNSETSQQCDCGYNFAAKTANEAYLNCSTRGRWVRRARWGAGALIFLAILGYCLQDQPFFVNLRRPSKVPKDAVFVFSTKTLAWERCNYDSHRDLDYCEVWNEDGEVIFNEVYLPLDGGPPIRAAQLKIQNNVRSGLGGEAICLENGRALVPKWLIDARKEGRADMNSLDPGCPNLHSGAGDH